MPDSRHAFATLVTNADYALGALALVRSLRLSGTAADIVVMHTGGVGPESLEPMAGLGARKAGFPHAARQFRQAAAVGDGGI